jgi:hypothetical protein
LPRLGSALPKFFNCTSLLEGIAEATGFATAELKWLMIDEMGLEANSSN